MQRRGMGGGILILIAMRKIYGVATLYLHNPGN
jgi:hypothetical protein